jgi:signal transduction histidine kinase
MTENQQQNTILIVDDSPENLQLLCEFLRGSGLKVNVAENGQAALEQVSQTKPDLILLDVVMPGLDGFETCQRLKSNNDTKDIPIIFMTALVNTSDKVRGFELGAVDHIAKPLQPDEVLARITTHLTIKNLQVSLQEQIIERDKLIGQLDAFAHTVAHDLKNPLGVITGYMTFLNDNWSDLPAEQAQELLQTIAQTGYKMSNIIEELLLLASIRQSEIKLKPLNMGLIVSESLLRLNYMLEEYNAEVVVVEEWPIALGHAQWIEEVWVNYISNGLKYGGEPPHLELGATTTENGMVRFWIRDNGPGISPEAQEKLFTRFTRLEETRAKGHGLGLSIVQHIMDRLGGDVGIKSTAGQGSEFFFTLPTADTETV